MNVNFYQALLQLIILRKTNETSPVTSWLFQDMQKKNLLTYAVSLKDFKKIDFILQSITEDFQKKLITEPELKTALQEALKTAIQMDASGKNIPFVKKIMDIKFDVGTKEKRIIQAHIDENIFFMSKIRHRKFFEKIISAKLSLKDMEKNCSLQEKLEILNDSIIINNQHIFNKYQEVLKTIKPIYFKRLIGTSVMSNRLYFVNYFLKNYPALIYGNQLIFKSIYYSRSSLDVFHTLRKYPQLLDELTTTHESPLMYSIKNNPKCIPYLTHPLDEKTYIRQLDCFVSSSILIATSKNNLKTVKTLLDHLHTNENTEAIKQLVLKKNIFGESALTLSHAKYPSILNHFYERFPSFTKIKINFVSTADRSVNISQGSVLNAMHYYLKLKYRSLEFFPNDGYCNGFNFLYIFYNALGKKEYFYRALKAMISWDGQESSLEKPFDRAYKDEDGEILYKNLNELFEQWISIVSWFQLSYHYKATLDLDKQSFRTKQEKNHIIRYQNARTDQLNIVNSKFLIDKACTVQFIYQQSTYQKIFESQFNELLAWFNSMKPGTIIELSFTNEKSEDAHTIALICRANGLSFYDSNHAFIFNETLTKEEIKLVSGIPYHYDWITYIIYQITSHDQTIQNTSLNQIFTKWPSASEELACQSKSENGFTPLHFAILLNDNEALSQLLEAKHNPFIKNAHGLSAWDLAIESANLLSILLITKHTFILNSRYKKVIKTFTLSEEWESISNLERKPLISKSLIHPEILQPLKKFFSSAKSLFYDIAHFSRTHILTINEIKSIHELRTIALQFIFSNAIRENIMEKSVFLDQETIPELRKKFLMFCFNTPKNIVIHDNFIYSFLFNENIFPYVIQSDQYIKAISHFSPRISLLCSTNTNNRIIINAFSILKKTKSINDLSIHHQKISDFSDVIMKMLLVSKPDFQRIIKKPDDFRKLIKAFPKYSDQFLNMILVDKHLFNLLILNASDLKWTFENFHTNTQDILIILNDYQLHRLIKTEKDLTEVWPFLPSKLQLSLSKSLRDKQTHLIQISHNGFYSRQYSSHYRHADIKKIQTSNSYLR